MGLVINTSFISEQFDVATATEDNVRFGFVIGLPFHLRVGTLYNCRFDVSGRSFDLWFRNRVSLPSKAAFETFRRDFKPATDLWTDVLVVVENPKIDKKSLDDLRKSDPEDIRYPVGASYLHHAMQAINHFIVAYGAVTGPFSISVSKLRVFQTLDFMDRLRGQVTIIMPKDIALPEAEIAEFFDAGSDRIFEKAYLPTGEFDFHDLSQEELVKIGEAISLHIDFIFYEFAFEARSKMMVDLDYRGGLLMAVAALEGAHAAFVGDVFASKLPPDSKKGVTEKLTATYLHELGMTLCNDLTPYLFMAEEDRPSPELIKSAADGLTYRNQIMHALRKRGQDRTRQKTNKELLDACSAVLKVYECYRKAFER